jgi:8-amino-7-oxononanoate synthase
MNEVPIAGPERIRMTRHDDRGYAASDRSTLLKLARNGAQHGNGRCPVMKSEFVGQRADVESLRACIEMRDRLAALARLPWKPFFPLYDGMGKNFVTIEGQSFLNFNTYDYLDLNGHSEILDAGTTAAARYGFSASASRVVGGERAVHLELERLLADIYQAEDCVVFVSGHATNVSTLATLFDMGDFIFHDSLSHNSIVQGALLSRATRVPFPHNDMHALDRLLTERRGRSGMAVLVSEGLFSMDGCLGNLPALVELKKKHRCLLMIDEAHSLGTLGATGRGTWEHFGLDPADVDIWMGTLSKTACTCGGYIASRKIVVEALKNQAPGFVFSVGMSPPLAAAARTALSIMLREPHRVDLLHRNAALFFEQARHLGLDTGKAEGHAVIPVMVGSSAGAFFASRALHDNGLCVMPVVYPAVEENAARLRFFLSAAHTRDDIERTLDLVRTLLPQAQAAAMTRTEPLEQAL